jgi:hypothetical protein
VAARPPLSAALLAAFLPTNARQIGGQDENSEIRQAWNIPSSASPSTLTDLSQMKPWQAFFRKDVPRRLKPGGVIESADMKMGFGR